MSGLVSRARTYRRNAQKRHSTTEARRNTEGAEYSDDTRSVAIREPACRDVVPYHVGCVGAWSGLGQFAAGVTLACDRWIMTAAVSSIECRGD